MTDLVQTPTRRTASDDQSPAGDLATKGFRPNSRKRNRVAAAVALGAVAIGGNVLVYSSLDDQEPIVQVVRDVPAGEQITPDMVRTVEADIDGSVPVVGDIDDVVGRYARVRLVSGSLVTEASLQSEPLIDDGNAVVAIQVPEGALPIGLRERVPVQLVVPADRDGESPPVVVDGRVVGLPIATESALGTVSLSVELAADDATVVAAADDVRVVLSVPSPDPAAEGS